MKHLKPPYLLLGLLLCCNLYLPAKIVKRCSSTEVLQRQLWADPSMKDRMDQIEQFTNSYIKSLALKRSGQASSNLGASISIPVVVHVVYNTSAQNVSDAMIQAQLDVLNKDYSATNTDKSKVPAAFASLVANTGIQFCLAKRDPSGNATTGIVRKSTSTIAFIDDDKVKYAATGGDNAWDASRYLNLWICNMANGILGYAQFPGGPASTDGVVILYSSLPGGSSVPYNKGRTVTHEVGHWLNLRHIWGDADCGNDYVNDTPLQQSANFGCPVYPHSTCSNTGDMSMNYMDYTDDECMYMFTNGQSARISALFANGGARASILSSNGCMAPATLSCEAPSGLSVGSITSSGATLNWAAVNGAISYTIQYKTSAATTWTTVISSTNSKVLTGLSAGTIYNYKVQAVCTSTGSYSTISSFTTVTAPLGCGTPSGLNAAAITTSGATLSWNPVSGAKKYNIQYKAATSSTWMLVSSSTHSKALTGLSAGTVYNYAVQAVCSTTGTYGTVAAFTTSSIISGCSDTYENNNTFSAAAVIPVNKDIMAQIGNATDVDWYKFSNTSSSPNIKITLSNLPKDYDLELYNATGNFLIMSDNAGTASEGIVYNAAPVGTYYVKVLGYGGIYSSSCYTLKAQTSNTILREMEVVDSKSAIKSDGKISIYPNPSTGDFNIKYISDVDKKVTITVYDLSGKVVSSDIYESAKGENLMNVSLPNAGNGIYLMDINDDIEKRIYKVVVNK